MNFFFENESAEVKIIFPKESILAFTIKTCSQSKSPSKLLTRTVKGFCLFKGFLMCGFLPEGSHLLRRCCLILVLVRFNITNLFLHFIGAFLHGVLGIVPGIFNGVSRFVEKAA